MLTAKRHALSSGKALLSEQAYLMVRERILRGQHPPGSVLSRRRLAKEFGMSFLPVSDALQRLESDGLVESRARVGTRVRTPTAEEVEGRYVVREALEAESAKLCCARATFQERLELRHMAQQLDSLYGRVEAGQNDTEFLYIVHEHHLNLHMKIAEYARCKELKAAIERNQVLIYNWFYDTMTPQQRILPPRFHHDLVDMVTGDEPRNADEAMRRHVRYGLGTVLSVVAPPTSGEWRLKGRPGLAVKQDISGATGGRSSIEKL